MIGSEWDTIVNYIKYYFEQFMAWFQALELPAQVLVAVLLFFGFIALAYIIYGSFWITIQSIKFSILVAGISIYITFVILGLPLVALSGVKNIPIYWTRAGENVKWFVASMYPLKADAKPVKMVSYAPKTSQNSPVVIIKEKNAQPKLERLQSVDYGSKTEHYHQEPSEEIPQLIDSPKVIESFCPDCGAPFSERMKYVLSEKIFTFCEECGSKIYKRE
ncbi:MAG: hypothetical protein JW776_03445 [Candidatus Lokiarchaeota archaeon]|nr:hypothetical protein [Candidatus Lokiarchaeota archaeon]